MMKSGVFAVALLLLLISSACKPTENNYRAAYDAALKKREAASSDEAYAGHKLMSDDTPRKVVAGADSVPMRTLPLNRVADGSPAMPFNAVVAAYKMKTNASGHAGRLGSAGYDAAVLVDAGSVYYVAIKEADTLAEAAEALARFAATDASAVSPGLSSGPEVIHSPARK